jgi:tetratricopeptide (TPR) repeat protein
MRENDGAVTSYEDLIAQADRDYEAGHYKEAHIAYGQALSMGTDRNDHCRRMRGTCSRLVAEQRMQRAVDEPDMRQAFLDQAARWLAKSEANLNSAFDESPESELGNIRLEQAKTEEAIARFMEMCGGDPKRRLSTAETYRREGHQLLASA